MRAAAAGSGIGADNVTMVYAANAGDDKIAEVKKTYSHPLKMLAPYLWITGKRTFGYERINEGGTTRNHAAIDFVSFWLMPVYGVTDGTVRVFEKNFYGGTDSIVVENDDGSWMRYAEIGTSLRAGDRVKKGKRVGNMIPNSIDWLSMLHLEYYAGTSEGGLNASSGSYKYVDDKNYRRRSDLLDPTFFKNLPKKLF